MLDYTKSFIENQFPVAKLSKESYRERKAGRSQTLTGLGKWWGRKPLILVRAALFGALLPVSDDARRDKEIFLKILTMDKAGFWRRHEKQAAKLQERDLFNQLEYSAMLDVSCRPEEIDGPDESAWHEINAHLETDAHSLQELAQQLGKKRFGHIPRVGDCFSGGGSNVFEPARMGCDVYGSDLNPLAGILTWADLHLLGCSEDEQKKLNEFQEKVFDEVCAEIDSLGVEENPEYKPHSYAKYYLYCHEIVCPECGYLVPTLPSLVVSKKQKLVVELEDTGEKHFAMHLVTVNDTEGVDKNATIQRDSLVCPHCRNITSIRSIRGGDEGSFLRKWERKDFVPRPDDIYQERLYAIKYVQVTKPNRTKEGLRKKPGPVTDNTFGESYYVEPAVADLAREERVYEYVKEHFEEWQEKGYIPSGDIAAGLETERLSRERGWKYWHQLFNPRQLLMLGLFVKKSLELAEDNEQIVMGLLGTNNLANRFAKLSIWNKLAEKGEQVFSNQALNTLFNYACRSSFNAYTLWQFAFNRNEITGRKIVNICTAELSDNTCDIWITDPPYADAVNYHELTEFFLAWDKALIKKAFPDWYTDTKRALAIKGTGKSFNQSMVAAYKNLAAHMPDNGLQIVMFTHQDTKVWAELAMILWSAGLQVTAAWCIATETESGGLKQGNYVKGTVLMVLRKRTTDEEAFEDELYEDIRDEVKAQIDSMHDLDDMSSPDFNDGDYLLAAYVAALKVLTSYANIEGLDVEYELEKARESKMDSPVTKIINTARKEAYDYLVPEGIQPMLWSKLSVEERFYIKGLGMEMNGVHESSAFQELARGFGVADYQDMLGSTKANKVRLKLPKEYRMTYMNEQGFGSSLLRQILAALYQSMEKDNVQEGCSYLRSHYHEGNKYWELRNDIVALLDFMAKMQGNKNVEHWQDTVEYIRMLREAIRNDGI